MDRIYTLPDLPAAPYSEVQALAKRLIEYRDFTTLLPLFDALQDGGDSALVKELKTLLFWHCQRIQSEERQLAYRWGTLAEELVEKFWGYLFSLKSTVDILHSDWYWEEREITPAAEWPVGITSTLTYTAEELIPAGAVVALDYTTHTVRIHPNTPEQQ